MERQITSAAVARDALVRGLDGDALVRGPGSYVLVRAGWAHTFLGPA